MPTGPRTTPGSSPLARGTPSSRHGSRRWQRIIPACAGNTHLYHSLSEIHQDHPRLRGEHCKRCLRPFLMGGSSPLARGTLQKVPGSRREVGIIPACAGNTRSRTHPWTSSRDHPRLRGEHAPLFEFEFDRLGSSPLARGTLWEEIEGNTFTRIIPACAGNTVHAHAPVRERRIIPACAGNTIRGFQKFVL